MLDGLSITTRELLYFTASILLIISLWNYYDRRKRIWSLVNKFPGPLPLPILGNALDFYFNMKDLQRIMYGNSKKYPRNIRLWFGHEPYIFLHKPEDIEAVLSNTVNINKGNSYKFFTPWLGNGLLSGNGHSWKTHRKLLTPAFHFRILENFLTVFNAHSKILICKLNRQIEKNDSFNILPFTSHCVIDILFETVMGIQVEDDDNSILKFHQVTERVKKLIDRRQKRIFLWPDLIFNLSRTGREHKKCIQFLHIFTEKIIQQKRVELNKNADNNNQSNQNQHGKKKCMAFIDLLFQTDDGIKLSDVEIRDQVTTFMFAGHDTISCSVGWALYLIGSHPDIQEKIQNELDSVLGTDEKADIKIEELRKLKYLESVLKESKRRLTPVPIIGRKLLEDINIEDYTLPAGVNVIINLLKLHKDPENFPKPSVFNPDRFLPENIQKRHTHSFIPFSAGPRNCIGQKFAVMEEKVIVSFILRTFTVKSLQTLQEVKPAAKIILTAEKGIELQFIPRKLKT